VAIELPDDWRAALAELQRRQERLAPGHFRWVISDVILVWFVFL
jgi:hypothetical protein